MNAGARSEQQKTLEDAMEHVNKAIGILIPVAGNHPNEEHGKILTDIIYQLWDANGHLWKFRLLEQRQHEGEA